MPDPIVLCDANIFYSILMTDLVLSLGEAGLYRPRWTDEIHEEWIRSVLRDQPQRTREQLERRRALMDRAIDHDLIENYQRHIVDINIPDPNDRHVLAAAIEAGAEILLTYNLRDFPNSKVAMYGVTVIHPDNLLGELIAEESKTVLSVIEEMRLKRQRPEISQLQLLESFSRLNIPGFVGMLRNAGYGVENDAQ
jgi:predicted nucleic acid-binding protein